MSQFLSIEKLKQIIPNIQLTVFGFIREAQQQLFGSNDDSYHIIPDLVTYITLNFYYERVFWEKINKRFTLSEDNKTLTCDKKTRKQLQGWDNASFVNIEIDSMQPCIAKWTLRIDKSKHHVMIGIIGGRLTTDVGLFESYDYAYWSASGESRGGLNASWKSYGDKFKDGDVIDCILDLKKKEISFHKNGIDQGVACEDVQCDKDFKFRLGVSVYFEGGQCSIIDFQQSM